MSWPPTPGNPGPPPSFGGDPFGGGGDPFGLPQQQGYTGGHPAQHPQQPGGQPQTAIPQPGPGRKRGNGWKWGLGALALLVVIAVTAVVTLSLSKGSDRGDNNAEPAPGGGASQSPTAGSNIASANDTGPATFITDDPTCAAWLTVDKGVGAAEQKTDWTNHDYKAPVAEWTPELRQTYATMSNAMTSAADQTVALVSKTPQRVMRELYEQFIAYARAFAKSLDTYTEVDQHLANASVLARSALDYACASIEWKAVATRGPFVPDPAPPTKVATPGDPSNPQRAITSPLDDCEKWATLIDTFSADTKAWGDLDSKLTAEEWSAEQRAMIDTVIPVMKKYADDVETLGRASGNPVVEDFAVFGAQYWRAYAGALPTYTTTDSNLAQTGARPPNFIDQACKALSG